jgi:hypothetical protein
MTITLPPGVAILKADWPYHYRDQVSAAGADVAANNSRMTGISIRKSIFREVIISST